MTDEKQKCAPDCTCGCHEGKECTDPNCKCNCHKKDKE